MEGANKSISPQELSKEFRNGLLSIEKEFLDKVSTIIPNGRYIVAIVEIKPKIIEIGSETDYFSKEQIEYWGIDSFWGLPHYPKVKYYRGTDTRLSDNGELFEFIVPMIPQNWLNKDTVGKFRGEIREGKKPTALALSILDIKTHYDNDLSHWCMTHYLIDGHHKVQASNLEEKPITLLSFFALGQGVSSDEDIKELLEKL